MKLLIVSNMRHYRRADGVIVGWGPTVEEIDRMSNRFDVIRHVACLHPGEPPASFRPYANERVELIPLPERGGDTVRKKLEFLTAMPGYASVILHELERADVVHLRCPANLPMIGASLLPFLRTPRARWIKYAGNWRPAEIGSLPFAYQRWLLNRSWMRAIVTVNGRWPAQAPHVRSLYNPSLADDEVIAARTRVAPKRLGSPVRLLFVGRLWSGKGCGIAISALHHLTSEIDATLDMIGDGPERAAYERQTARLGLETRVTFHGALSREALAEHYARAHFTVLPSRTEGWPKVLSEGMAYGAVPIASAVGAIPQLLREIDTGRALPQCEAPAFASAILAYVRAPDVWQAESQRAMQAASLFTYSHYERALNALLEELRVR